MTPVPDRADDCVPASVQLEDPVTSKTAPVSFANDIRPLFRPIDLAHMTPLEVRLGDYDYMSDATDDHRNARAVGAFLSGAREPRMPVGGPFWTAAQLALYQRWMTDGFQP